jgi:hypothetical protein
MVAREMNARKLVNPGLPTPNKGEAFDHFYARCLTEIQDTPLELKVPVTMVEEHERASSRFRELQRGFRWPFEGPNRTAPRETIF